MSKRYTVIDFFCGAGGFSEGFRQNGFKILEGIDLWQPAIDSFDYNFNLDNTKQDILCFNDINNINNLPNTEIIIGSPPCVAFSTSNKCGNTDKTLGVNLINTFLRIVTVKKYQKESNLKAWFLENVPNSLKYFKDYYTFNDLDLKEWAKGHNINPNSEAIRIKGNCEILNSADFGVAQNRKRLFVGEITLHGKFPELEKIHCDNHISIKKIFKDFPTPFTKNGINFIMDPNYQDLELDKKLLTDYSYDTGVYKSHWEYSQWCKENHPYMGKMSFPENYNKPSRTITATKLNNSREAIIYTSEIRRKDNGKYRTPTIREIAILMSFPITYQFLGSEYIKWRLVGNAVCPLVSSAIAKAVLKSSNEKIPKNPIINTRIKLDKINNLNNSKRKKFNNPPKFKKGKRFRRHPFKDGNMTITLSNYSLKENPKKADGKWRTTITYGTGQNFKLQEFNIKNQDEIKNIIKESPAGEEFIYKVNNGFSKKIANAKELQKMHEGSCSNGKLHPIELIEATKQLVEKYTDDKKLVIVKKLFEHKENIFEKQLYSLYAINQISKVANGEKNE